MDGFRYSSSTDGLAIVKYNSYNRIFDVAVGDGFNAASTLNRWNYMDKLDSWITISNIYTVNNNGGASYENKIMRTAFKDEF
jgi:hypothetical protein